MQYIDDVMDYAAWVANHPQEAAYVKPASHWCEEVIAQYHDPRKVVSVSMPILKSPDLFGFRPQEVTIWSGVNGHGKSSLLSACALYWADNGERICIASLEMAPVKQLVRMVRQATGKERPDAELIRRFHSWTDANIWLYNQTGTVKSNRMLDLGRYVASEIKCTHFVIDSFMKCGIPSDGVGWLTAQKTFMDEICALAKDTHMHVHVVMHPRKGETENTPMDKMDVRGAGELTDMADNLITLHKNVKKTEAISMKQATMDQIMEPDFILAVKKQRHGEWTGKVPLWSEPVGMQFLKERTDAPPKPWVT